MQSTNKVIGRYWLILFDSVGLEAQRHAVFPWAGAGEGMMQVSVRLRTGACKNGGEADADVGILQDTAAMHPVTEGITGIFWRFVCRARFSILD